MNLSEKIKTMNNKINQNKGQFDLEREINMNSPLSSGNVGWYELLTGKDVLPEKLLL